MPTYEQIVAMAEANLQGQIGVSQLGIDSDATQLLTSIYPPLDLGDVTLAGSEWLALVRFLAAEFYPRFPQRDIRLFASKLGPIAIAAVAAKGYLGGTLGPISTGSLVPQVLRPATVYASGGTVVENWLKASVTAGWNSAFWTISTNNSSATTSISTQNNSVVLLLGFADLASSPRLFEYQVKDSATVPLGVHSLPLIHTFDGLNIWELEEALLIPKNTQYTVDLNFESTGSSIPIPLGLEFVTRQLATAE